MGAGQIGGIATLLDIDFKNAAGFLGREIDVTEGQFMVYYLSHAMMFCVGALIEPHVVLTPASCIYGEKYKFDVFGGSHKFIEYSGVGRTVQHICIHREYNHTSRWTDCSTANIGLLVMNKSFSFNIREHGTEFVINRVRYGSTGTSPEHRYKDETCRYYGWGSRRNGYLIPLLIEIRRMDVVILPPDKCTSMWRYENKYLCIQQPLCKSSKYGALCPDDMGSVVVCSGFAQGMMTSRLVDRPCGVGFLDLSNYNKFLTCGVDDSRDIIEHIDDTLFDFTTVKLPSTLAIRTPPSFKEKAKEKRKEEEKETGKEEKTDKSDNDTKENED